MESQTISDGYRDFLKRQLPALRQKALPPLSLTQDTKHDTLRHCLATERIPETGLIAEFGVFKGTTIRMIAKRYPDRRVYGFDSFEGFPDDGRKDWQQDFSLQGQLPTVPGNVSLIKGYFADTLATFTKEQQGQQFALLHIDCDLYSSTQTIFRACRDLIAPGCLIVFDELLHYAGFLTNELLAFYEFLEESGRDFEWIAIRDKVMSLDEFLVLRQDPTSFVLGPMKGWRQRAYEQEVALRIL